jgi:hypothetical protein
MDALQVDQEVGAGLTHENNLIDVDPKFVNAAHGNFSLRPGSLAFRFGFQQLPSASIGPRDRTAEKMVRHAKVALHIR